MIFLLVPETKQRTLEQLDLVFSVSTRDHMRYQVFKVLPWWVNTYVFRRKVGKCPALWTFEGSMQDDQAFVERVRQQAKEEREGRRTSQAA